MTASEQFREFTGLDGSPDPALGLENAKGKGGGKTMDAWENEGQSEKKDEKKAPAKKTAKK